MENLIGQLIAMFLAGGSQGIIAVLILIIGFLVWERRRLLSEIQRKDEKIDKIIEEYYKGNLTLTQALNSLKLVLYEIKTRVS